MEFLDTEEARPPFEEAEDMTIKNLIYQEHLNDLKVIVRVERNQRDPFLPGCILFQRLHSIGS